MLRLAASGPIDAVFITTRITQEDERREGQWAAAGPSWVSSEWQATEAGAVQILPYGLDGHQVKEVVGSMRLQRIVLLTDCIEVGPPCAASLCQSCPKIVIEDGLSYAISLC